MQNIYTYKNYRDFLKDSYTSRKLKDPQFSYAHFSQLAGLGSANYLKLIIEGQRNLTVENIFTFARALRMRAPEQEYFETMVLENQCEGKEAKSFYRQRLSRLKATKPKSQARLDSFQEILTHWYAPAILLFFTLDKIPSDKEIARWTGTTAEEVQKLLAEYLKMNILTPQDTGGFKLNADHLVVNQKPNHQGQRKFLKSQLQRSMQELDKNYLENAKFYSHTFTCGADSFPKYWREILEFIENLNREADLEVAEKVLQLNLQFFPVA